VVVAALAAPWLSPFDPVEQDIGNRLKPPVWRDAFGSSTRSAPITSGAISWRA
jgi:hypothetical protein